jgi:hypothetical protein
LIRAAIVYQHATTEADDRGRREDRGGMSTRDLMARMGPECALTRAGAAE